ncbi:hypothetical protein PFISCL1PPCAC_17836, partial [Pristionchus fissidentatus]
MSWNDAQKKCSEDFGSLATVNSAQENKFFWRSAISQNVLDDLHLGAFQSSDDGVWKWIDDGKNVSGYTNFETGFPFPGAGSCVGMLTESSTAKWTNEDCDNQKLPFVCRRYDYSTFPKDCSSITPVEGKDIVAPGFPVPSIPCEISLFVDANSLVQLEILNLEANPNMDFLELYEGSIGKNLLANLTGTSANPSMYMTKSSNIMRVNWKSNEDVRPPEYRGFRV